MTSIQNISNLKLFLSKPLQPSFKGTEEKKEVSQIDKMPAVTPDYGVKTPMGYSFVEDIKLSDDLTAKCYKLSNGQKIVIVPKDGVTVVKSYVNTGSMNEPDNLRGISHYIEHNLFNGSEDLGNKDFFSEVNKMGANTNASTSFSATDYFISSNLLDDKDLEEQIKLHAGMLQSPKFLVEKLEKEKDIVNSEINMYSSDPLSLGYTETIKSLFNVKTTSNDLVAGSTNNITALTRDDVVNYFNNNYFPANITTVITGEVNPDDTMKLISKYFTSTKSPVQNRHFEEFRPIDKPVRRDIISTKTENSANVFLGFVGPKNSEYKDKLLSDVVLCLATKLANSRFKDLENNNATNVHFGMERIGSRPQDETLLLVDANVAESDVEPYLKELYTAIQKLSTNPPTNEELTSLKNSMKKSKALGLERSHSLNFILGDMFLNNTKNMLSEYDSIIDNMTSQDVADFAKKYLDLNKVAITVVHPNKANTESISKNYEKAKGLSFTGANKKTPINSSKITEYQMPNNFNVVLHDSNSNKVEYRFALEEKDWSPKKYAVADVLSYMMEEGGTKNLSNTELNSKQDILGISSGLSVGEKGTSISASLPVDSLKEGLALFNDRVKNPNLSQENFDKAIKHYKNIYTSFEVSAYDKYNKSMYEGLPSGITQKDKLKSLDGLTLQDVKDFYNEIMTNAHGQVTVTAPFSKRPELKQLVFDNVAEYGTVKPKDISLLKKYKPIESTQVHTDVHNKNQAEILEGFRFEVSGNIKDSICLDLMNGILGGSASSRLFTDLRESRHLAYSVCSSVDSVNNMGVITLDIATTTENMETGETSFDNIKKSINGFNENIKKLTSEKVTQEELDSAKKALKNEMLTVAETDFFKTSIISSCSNSPYGVDFMNKKLAMIDSITPEDILNTAKYVFKGKPIYSIVATNKSLEENKEFLESLNA